MKSQTTVGKKLFLSIGALVVLTLGIGLFALSGFNTLGKGIETLVKVNARRQYLAGHLNTAFTNFAGLDRGLILRSYTKDLPTMQKYDRQFQAAIEVASKDLGDFTALIETAEAARLCADLRVSIERLREAHDTVYNFAKEGQAEAANAAFVQKALPVAVQGTGIAERLLALQSELMNQRSENALATVSMLRWLLGGGVLLSLSIAFAVVFIVRQINKGLRTAVAEMHEGAQQIALAAGHVSSSSNSLAQGASRQAASLEETSASSEEINSMAKRNSESSRDAAVLVARNQQQFAKMTLTLDQLVAAIAEINTQSGRISKIIKVIDEIAFQTNILALNAAVEAARAGQAGMGFAVVADEVRNLAQRCAQAAKDTSALIEESITKSKDGKVRVDEVTTAIAELAQVTVKVKALVDDVSRGSEEQARGMEQIAKAITQMEQVTQNTAAHSEEGAAAAEQLNAQSGKLKDVVETLTAMVGGAG